MPKKKSGFIDKTKAVKFLLDFRDPEDPNYRNKQATERVLKPYELLRSKKEKYDLKARNKLIRKLAEEPYQFEERVEWDESDNEKEERETRDKKRADRKAAAAAGPKKPVVTADIMEQIKGRKDLWFNELHKNDPADAQKKPINVDIQPVPKGAKKEKHVTFKEPLDAKKKAANDKKKKVEEEEEDEWEDEEEEEVEEIEMDEEEWEDAAGDWEDEGDEEEEQMKKEKKPKKEFKMIEKDIELDHEAIEKLQPAEGVQMKRYDENGLPMDGYDYYQHIAGDEGPEPVAVFTADYKMPVKLAVDIDMKPEDMNPDEKEVFQAMEDEDCLDDAGYDMLDDDFIKQANEGEAALVAADPKAKSKKGAKGAAKDTEKTTGSGGNSLGLFMNNPNVKINIKDKGALDARNLDVVMKEFDDADRPQNMGPGMSNDAFDNILNEHMQGMRSKAHFEDFIIKEQKKQQREREAQMESEKPDKLLNYFEQLKPENDQALQRHLQNASDSEPEEEEMVRMYMANPDEDKTTNISVRSVNNSRVQKQLNIIKEDNKKAKKEEEIKPVVQEESDEEEDAEDLGAKLKRSKKETKEERKARKEAVKEAKKERKEKKQSFKDQFKAERVKSIKTAVQQNANLEGLTVYKL